MALPDDLTSRPDQHLDPVVAAHYDDAVADRFRPDAIEPAVAVLAELAGDGVAVEFAVDTGRLALPLAATGTTVQGIDRSEPMLAQLRKKTLTWPFELDLMAQPAGMVLEDRWAGWSRQPFTAESPSHVSVWRKP